MKNKTLTLLCGSILLTVGCSTAHKGHPSNHESDFTALQGNWHGHVLQRDTDHSCSFAVSGHDFEFHDLTETNAWYKGIFALREDTTPRQYVVTITDCPFPQYIGKNGTAIYQVNHDTLMITANEPGNPVIPTSFDSPDSARLEVKRN